MVLAKMIAIIVQVHLAKPSVLCTTLEAPMSLQGPIKIVFRTDPKEQCFLKVMMLIVGGQQGRKDGAAGGEASISVQRDAAGGCTAGDRGHAAARCHHRLHTDRLPG